MSKSRIPGSAPPCGGICLGVLHMAEPVARISAMIPEVQRLSRANPPQPEVSTLAVPVTPMAARVPAPVSEDGKSPTPAPRLISLWCTPGAQVSKRQGSWPRFLRGWGGRNDPIAFEGGAIAAHRDLLALAFAQKFEIDFNAWRDFSSAAGDLQYKFRLPDFTASFRLLGFVQKEGDSIFHCYTDGSAVLTEQGAHSLGETSSFKRLPMVPFVCVVQLVGVLRAATYSDVPDVRRATRHTNNIGEITALVMVMEMLGPIGAQRCVFRSDSMYALDLAQSRSCASTNTELVEVLRASAWHLKVRRGGVPRRASALADASSPHCRTCQAGRATAHVCRRQRHHWVRDLLSCAAHSC